jgi:hypothetical protein
MARNLLAKIPSSDNLIIRDVNDDVMQRFIQEANTADTSNSASRVQIASSVREVAEKSVGNVFV